MLCSQELLWPDCFLNDDQELLGAYKTHTLIRNLVPLNFSSFSWMSFLLFFLFKASTADLGSIIKSSISMAL